MVVITYPSYLAGTQTSFYFLTLIYSSFEKSSKDPIALCSTLTAHLNAAAINSPDVYQRTALHLAANRGAGICAIHLLEVSDIDLGQHWLR